MYFLAVFAFSASGFFGFVWFSTPVSLVCRFCSKLLHYQLFASGAGSSLLTAVFLCFCLFFFQFFMCLLCRLWFPWFVWFLIVFSTWIKKQNQTNLRNQRRQKQKQQKLKAEPKEPKNKLWANYCGVVVKSWLCRHLVTGTKCPRTIAKTCGGREGERKKVRERTKPINIQTNKHMNMYLFMYTTNKSYTKHM